MFDNITIGQPRSFFANKKEAYLCVSNLLEQLGMTADFLEQPTWTLSLSERQIVTIARALLHNWKLLIIDEGTSALDSKQAEMLSISGISVAVGNAIPKIKSIATHVTDSSDDDGVSKAIESLLLSNSDTKSLVKIGDEVKEL